MPAKVFRPETTEQRAPRSCALVMAVLALSGCQKLDRARECRAIARAVNPVLASIDGQRNKAPDAAASYRAIGTSYDALALKLGTLGVTTKRMVETLTDYERVLREGGRDARLFADALDAKDLGKIGSARSSAARTTRHESAAATRMDSLCRPR